MVAILQWSALESLQEWPLSLLIFPGRVQAGFLVM